MNKISRKILVAMAVFAAAAAIVFVCVPPLLSPYSDEPQAVPKDTLVNESQLPPIEKRARNGDVEAMDLLIDFYHRSVGPDLASFDIVTGQNEASIKARYWLEMAIRKGDQNAIYGSASDHAERAMVNRLSPEERRKYGYRAMDLYLLLHNGDYRDAMTPQIQEMLGSLRQLDGMNEK